jgi:hypothetical protein
MSDIDFAEKTVLFYIEHNNLDVSFHLLMLTDRGTDVYQGETLGIAQY